MNLVLVTWPLLLACPVNDGTTNIIPIASLGCGTKVGVQVEVSKTSKPQTCSQSGSTSRRGWWLVAKFWTT